MNYNEFKAQYLHIGLHKEPAKKPDDLGRMRIGTFGIGFLAPLPYCKKMTIITKCKGDTNAIQASINAENFFSKGNWNITKEKVPYEITKSDLPKAQGETIVILEDIKDQIREELGRKKSTSRAKLDQLSGFDKFKWTLCQYCPIQFPPERKDLREFFDEPDRVPLQLWLDGKELFRNVPSDSKVLEKGKQSFGNIQVKYIIMTPYTTVKPEEARGLQLRLRNVAVGFPQDFDVTKLGRVLGRLNYLCGEVHITKGLDNALMVTRDSFNYTEEVTGLYDFFRDKLTRWNDKLYKEADEDKSIYESLPDEDAEVIAKELKRADIVRFPKERFRLSKSSLTAKKLGDVSLPADKLKQALSKRKDYSVISSGQRRKKDDAPIKVDSKRKTITIYNQHPSFLDTLEVNNKKYVVTYDKWDYHKTSYSICKFDKKQNKATFNTDHPLFKSKVNERIIKQLSLGALLILEGNKEKDKLVSKFNHLLEEVFQG